MTFEAAVTIATLYRPCYTINKIREFLRTISSSILLLLLLLLLLILLLLLLLLLAFVFSVYIILLSTKISDMTTFSTLGWIGALPTIALVSGQRSSATSPTLSNLLLVYGSFYVGGKHLCSPSIFLSVFQSIFCNV